MSPVCDYQLKQMKYKIHIRVQSQFIEVTPEEGIRRNE